MAPVKYVSGSGSSGVTSATGTVTSATGAGDALVVGIFGGASVTSVTDSKGNSYSLAGSYTTNTPYLSVYAATGATAALTTSDTVTVAFASSTSGAWAFTGVDCPGVSTQDVANTASGKSATASVSVTPGSSGETAIAILGWTANGGGVNVNSPFTQLTQQALASSAGYLTTAYDLSPAAGTSLTASANLNNSLASWRAVLVTFEAGAVTEADTGGAADVIAVQATSIPRAIIQAPPVPAGPAPPPVSPQVLLAPAGRSAQQDAAAAADTFAVTAETIQLADTAAAVDYPASQIFQADAAGAADTLTVSTAVPLPDAAAAADTAGPATVQASLADTAAAVDLGQAAGLAVPDTGAAAETLAVTAVASLTDTAAASDNAGSAQAIGASGGAGRPQAWPGTSQVAVAAPGSSTWQYLASIGTVTALTYSYTCPGGCDKMTATIMVPASYRTTLFNPGWQVRITRGGHIVWTGKLDEPAPTPQGWNLTAAGTGNLGTNFRAIFAGWPTGEPDQPVNLAISRGLPWVNPGIGQPAGAWFGQAADPGSQTITDVLNLVCTRGGLTWYVNAQPGGLPGNDLSVFPLPATPNRLLVCTTPVARTLGGDINTIFIRYMITADTTDSNGNSIPATYGLVSVQNQASAAQHGVMETYVDLSDAGVMTALQAETVGGYVLAIYQRASFAGPFTIRYGELLNTGGVPVDPGTDQAGTVCRLVLTDFGYGGEVTMQPVEFITGQYVWDDFALTATITPYQTLNMSLAGLLSLENTLLTPVQAAG